MGDQPLGVHCLRLIHGSGPTDMQQIKRELADLLFVHYKPQLKSPDFIMVLTASLVLYYEETYHISPSHLVHRALPEALISVLPTLTESQAYDLLLKWSGYTRSVFVFDNLLGLRSSDGRYDLSEDEASRPFVCILRFDDTLDERLRVCDLSHRLFKAYSHVSKR